MFRPTPTRSPAVGPPPEAPVATTSRLQREFPSLFALTHEQRVSENVMETLVGAVGPCSGTPSAAAARSSPTSERALPPSLAPTSPALRRTNSLEHLRLQVAEVSDILPRDTSPPQPEQRSVAARILDAGRPAWQQHGLATQRSQPNLQRTSPTATATLPLPSAPSRQTSAYETLGGDTSWYPVVRSSVIEPIYGHDDPRAGLPKAREQRRHGGQWGSSGRGTMESARAKSGPKMSASMSRVSDWPLKPSKRRDVELEMSSASGTGRARPKDGSTPGWLDSSAVAEVIDPDVAPPPVTPRRSPRRGAVRVDLSATPRYCAFADRSLRAREGLAARDTLMQPRGGDTDVHGSQACAPQDLPSDLQAAGLPSQQLQEHKYPPLCYTDGEDALTSPNSKKLIGAPRSDPLMTCQRRMFKRSTTFEVLGDAPPSPLPGGKADEVRAEAGVRHRPASFSPRAGSGWRQIGKVKGPPWTVLNRDGEHPRDYVSLQAQETPRWMLRKFEEAYTPQQFKDIVFPEDPTPPPGVNVPDTQRAPGECAQGFSAFVAKCRLRENPQQYRYNENPGFRLTTWERSASAPPRQRFNAEVESPAVVERPEEVAAVAQLDARKAGLSSAEMQRGPLTAMFAGNEAQKGTPRRPRGPFQAGSQVAEALVQKGAKEAAREHGERLSTDASFRDLCEATDKLQQEHSHHRKVSAYSRANVSSDSARACMQWCT